MSSASLWPALRSCSASAISRARFSSSSLSWTIRMSSASRAASARIALASRLACSRISAASRWAAVADLGGLLLGQAQHRAGAAAEAGVRRVLVLGELGAGGLELGLEVGDPALGLGAGWCRARTARRRAGARGRRRRPCRSRRAHHREVRGSGRGGGAATGRALRGAGRAARPGAGPGPGVGLAAAARRAPGGLLRPGAGRGGCRRRGGLRPAGLGALLLRCARPRARRRGVGRLLRRTGITWVASVVGQCRRSSASGSLSKMDRPWSLMCGATSSACWV